MLVAEPGKWPLDLLVDEGVRPIESGDLAREFHRHAEVAGAPGHGLSRTDQPMGPTADSRLARGCHRGQVEIDVPGQVEDPIARAWISVSIRIRPIVRRAPRPSGRSSRGRAG